MGNPKQKWTSEEEEALRAGVRKHGTGKWKDIQKDPEFNPYLSSRSNIDLKDKWRNMSVSGGMGGVREKAKAKPRDSPVTLFANPTTPQTSAAASVKRGLSAAPLTHEPSSVPVKREAASSLIKGEPGADDSPTEAKTSQLSNQLIFEALSTSKAPNGLETGAIANFIEQRYILEKKTEQLPQNFRRLLSSRLRRLVQQEKIEKFQNCFKMKSDSPGETKVPLPPTPPVPNTPKPIDTPPVPKENETPPAPKQIDIQFTQLQIPADVIPYETVEEAAVAAAFKIAEAENKSFVAAEAVKESERVSQMFEDTNSVLQLAEEFLKKCLQGEVLLLV